MLHSARRFLPVLRWRLEAHILLAVLVVSCQLGQVVVATAASLAMQGVADQGRSLIAACDQPSDGRPGALCAAPPRTEDPLSLAVPTGQTQCPDSGPGAGCANGGASARPAPGVSSLPPGNGPCPQRIGTHGPNAPAACTNIVLASPQPGAAGSRRSTPLLPQRATPSVPVWTLDAAQPQLRVRLTTDYEALKPGQSAILTATAGASVTGTRSTIEIFDQTTGTLAGACSQGSQCLVAYAARSGVHTFAAYVTPPVGAEPTENVITSNPVSVAWFAVSLKSSPTTVGPGKPVTFTATATADVAAARLQLGLYDADSGARITYCGQGTSCSTTITKSQAGLRSIVAYVAGASDVVPLESVQAQSAQITATWLGVVLDANTSHPQVGGTVFMKATANIDVTNTPWSIGIYDEQGNLVADACKSGRTCSARVTITTGSTPSFTAVVGAARPLAASGSSAPATIVSAVQRRASLVDIQVRSTPVQPTRLLWGVDSCKPFTTSPMTTRGLYPQVTRYYGTPDFWGRYLTNTYNCPGISSTEVEAATFRHMGILPIYNDYDCSAVHGYVMASRYAAAASAAATNLGIPTGTVLAIDIEPPGDYCPGAGRVDAGFIQGWYDGITSAGYSPMYYGNGTAGSEFASAWCRAVKLHPQTAVGSFLWSFEPSLQGRFTRARAPEYSPFEPGCDGNLAAWQYMLSAGGKPDVDSDEAISNLPLWFPGVG